MPGNARIDQEDLEANYPPGVVRRVFSDDGSGIPGPRLARACQRASRRAESILLRAWSDAQIDKLFEEDESVVAATCGLAIFYGVEGKTEWTGQGAPYEGLERRCLAELRDLADGKSRSRGEAQGAGTNPTITGRTNAPCPQYVFAESRKQPRRGGY